MKKLIIDIAYIIAIAGFVGGGCYNILSVRPDIVAELPRCIQMVYSSVESMLDTPELEADVEPRNNTLETERLEVKIENTHIHEWKVEEVFTWQSNGDGTGRLIIEEVRKCDCGDMLTE